MGRFSAFKLTHVPHRFTPDMMTLAWIWDDFGIGSIIAVCFGIALFIFGVLGLLDLRRSPPADIRAWDQTVFASFSGIITALALVGVT
jgi:hypothetical protein